MTNTSTEREVKRSAEDLLNDSYPNRTLDEQPPTRTPFVDQTHART